MAFWGITMGSLSVEADFVPVDTQPAGRPLPPLDAGETFSLPPGFQLTMAVAEPEVRQPIAVTFDDRGRLWVAESYSYDGSDFTSETHDRILIFDDLDGDGTFETRQVFQEGLNRLTGLLWGFGGLWVASAPHLTFIPDRNGDDHPDGPPEVHLDGWTLKAEHNSVNGLSWGPDGWLYGRHGVKAPSLPGRPEVPVSQRRQVSCSIWRYHPVRHEFQVVAEGTVNPWGLDYDDYGQMFISSSVVNHLWHVIPGAHFEGSPFAQNDPFIYEMMGATADHTHRPKPRAPGTAQTSEDDGGGGHSHVDVMFYLGGRWPAEYHNSLFIQNFMGRQVNHDRLERDPISDRYVARHEPSLLKVGAPWFRGVGLRYGPDGDVILTDWSDEGECHDRDGVSRTTGRIYKLSWGKPRRVKVNLENASPLELADLQTHTNDWFVRHARRLLQERSMAGEDMSSARAALIPRLKSPSTTTPQRLRALWALHAIGATPTDLLMELLEDSDEHIRHWAVRLLANQGPVPTDAHSALIALASRETAWLPRLALASALAAMDRPTAWEVGRRLAWHLQTDDDVNLARLLWIDWQSTLMEHPDACIDLLEETPNLHLRQWIARRLGTAALSRPSLTHALLQKVPEASSDERRRALLQGLEASWSQLAPPNSHDSLTPLRAFYEDADPALQILALQVGVRLQDPRAIQQLHRALSAPQTSTLNRIEIMDTLVTVKPPGLLDDLLAWIDSPTLAEPALRNLRAYDDARIGPAVLAAYPHLHSDRQRRTAIDTLLTRSAWTHDLLDALASGQVEKSAISQFQARQITGSTDRDIVARFESLWGRTNPSPEHIAKRMKELRMILKDKAFMSDGDIAVGHQSFLQRCAACHTLFDEGGTLGPDLSGSGRHDLEYLLINVIDPNASILANWRLAVLTLEDGQVLSGTLAAEREDDIELQTTDGRRTILRSDITSIQRMDHSLMPTGLLDDMTAQQVRDLFAFLMSDETISKK